MRLLEHFLAAWRRPDIAIFHRFQTSPFGGSNQFLVALRSELERRKIRVAANLVGPRTRAALLNAYAFDADRLRRMRHPRCRIVHRVDGPVGRYRGQDAEIDRHIASWNHEFAAATVFQSQYSLAAHREIGLSFMSPVVIPNAVDPAIFHQVGRAARDEVLRGFPEVWQVVGKAGRAETPTDAAPLDMIETVINLRDHEVWTKRKLKFNDAMVR